MANQKYWDDDLPPGDTLDDHIDGLYNEAEVRIILLSIGVKEIDKTFRKLRNAHPDVMKMMNDTHFPEAYISAFIGVFLSTGCFPWKDGDITL